MRTHTLAVLPGDGSAWRSSPRAWPCSTEWRSSTAGSGFVRATWPWSCQWYLENGRMMPADGLDRLADSDAIYLAPSGCPRPCRTMSRSGACSADPAALRPVRQPPTGPGARGHPEPAPRSGAGRRRHPLRPREHRGEYSGMGGRFHAGKPEEVALQTSVFTRRGIERIARYAFEQARHRRRRLASATKSNALRTAPSLDEVVAEVGRDFPDVELTPYHVDPWPRGSSRLPIRSMSSLAATSTRTS